MSVDLPWIREAKKHIGTREIPGRGTNQKILKWWSLIRAPFTDDETPWCAAFVGGCLESCGIPSTRRANARSYVNWGVRLRRPTLGSVVVFWRGRPDGWAAHVGFTLGREPRSGNLVVLGGNQSDSVSIKPFDIRRVLDFRWPLDWPLPDKQHMPVIASTEGLSTDES